MANRSLRARRTASASSLRVTNRSDLERAFRPRPAVMLSASVPYPRDPPEGMPERERALRRATEKRYMATMRPGRIRVAVVEFARALLMRGGRLVFGAHPAISPMLLVAARDVRAEAESVLIFQSEYFEAQIPGSTLELADWSVGRLIMTPRVLAASEAEARTASLKRMRELMTSVPGLRGAVLIGGMDGVVEEATLFRALREGLPRYAIASTGAAAQELFDSEPGAFCGKLRDRTMLTAPQSFGALAQIILDDLGIPLGSPPGAAAA